MKKNFFLLLLLLTTISCGKRRKILEQGTAFLIPDSTAFSTQVYLDHDSAFFAWTDKSNGKLFLVEKSPSLQDLKDSTYVVSYYYENGNLMKIKSYSEKIPVGNWMEYYPDKKKKGETRFQNGRKTEFTSWWENGKVNLEISYLAEGKIIHHEFFENGNPAAELRVDSSWNGSCTYFYENGKKKGEGSVFHKNPSGFWKMFDTLGNPSHDTLFLAEGPLKVK